jgi:hypothetical protein
MAGLKDRNGLTNGNGLTKNIVFSRTGVPEFSSLLMPVATVLIVGYHRKNKIFQ